MISSLLSLQKLLFESGGLLLELTLEDLLGKFQLIILGLQLLKVVGEPLPILSVLSLLLFSLVHELLLHFIDLDLSFLSTDHRFSV